MEVELGGEQVKLRSGSVVIAAITSCTNTSNPSVMVAAGLLARNAVARGLRTPAWVKTSLAPGSRAVTDYLEGAGLMEPLEELGFDLVGYGCTTCIGNSGPLAEPIAEAIDANDLVGVAVLSGNRNFEGRIHPQARASYLASPPLVVAFALAGRIDVDLTTEPLGIGADGQPVFLERAVAVERGGRDGRGRAGALRGLHPQLRIGLRRRRALARRCRCPTGDRYAWDPDSTYVALPPFFAGARRRAGADRRHRGRAGAGDAGRQRDHRPHLAGRLASPRTSPAGTWLIGARRRAARLQLATAAARGHHEVMMRGTFANIRLHNLLTPDAGGQRHRAPAQRRADEHLRRRRCATPPTGRRWSCWPARSTARASQPRLGCQGAVPAGRAGGDRRAYERIHRSNLVGMGILPLQYLPGESVVLAGADRARDLHDRRHRRRAPAAPGADA